MSFLWRFFQKPSMQERITAYAYAYAYAYASSLYVFHLPFAALFSYALLYQTSVPINRGNSQFF